MMPKPKTYIALTALLVAAIAIPIYGQTFGGQAGLVVQDRTLPEAEKVFSPAFPGNDAVKFAAAFGDRNTGAHGTFGQFPANFETPEHTHTHDYRAIVTKGVMTNPFVGEVDPKALPVGSYWEVSAGSVHTTACISDTPCEFFMFGEASFDFVAHEE